MKTTNHADVFADEKDPQIKKVKFKKKYVEFWESKKINNLNKSIRDDSKS